MWRRLLLAVLATGACVPAKATSMTWPTLDPQLPTDSAATYRFRLGIPKPLAITRDGAVLFSRTPAREFAADLFELDSKTGAVKTLLSVDELVRGGEQLSDAEKARRERTRTATRGVVDIGVSDDGRTVFVPLGGVFYLIDRTTGQRTVIDPQGDAYDPHLSPDGTHVAFVRDADLWVIGRTGPARRLAKHPDGFEYGIADFAAQEELDRRRGFWWSPDSKQLLFQRSDVRPVDTIYVADALHNDRPPVPFKYPRAGRANAILDLGLVSVEGGDPKWITWDRSFEYLARVQWSAGGPPTIVVLTREQEALRLLAIEGGKTREILAQTSPDYIEMIKPESIEYEVNNPLWLPDRSGFLWLDESPGAWTLQLRAPDGKLVRTLTPPELPVRLLAGIDGDAAIVTGSADPTRGDVWRVPLAGGAPVRVPSDDGISIASFAHGVIVVETRLAAGGKRVVAIASGKTFELPSVGARPRQAPTTVLETVEVGGRTHHVAITRPRAFDRARRYPVLLDVYAGPQKQMVEAAGDEYIMDQWYADAGFVVVRSDGRGTPNRERAWTRAIHEDLITVPLEDQIGALHAMAARHPEMDLARVGVFGWSFGGYFSAMAVLLRPDVFRCAIAGAPVTDWQLYDTAYTERYMRTPEHNPDGYARTSALAHAAKLARPLMIIHGITDDNVHFAHTLALIEALYVAGKYAVVITQSSTHMVPDPKLALAREQVQIDFFREHL